LREHKNYASYDPDISFTNIDGSLKISSTLNSLGRGYAFVAVPREWLNGKYIRFSWYIHYSATGANEIYFYYWIYDGAYDPSSDTDFPSGSGIATKGAGQLYSGKCLTDGTYTVEFQADTSGGTQEYCTIFLTLSDISNSYSAYAQIYWFEINTGPNGQGNLYREEFDDTVVMQRTGTIGDYGYISSGEVGSGGGIFIGGFQAPSVIRADTYFLLNATIIANVSVSEFINATVELENGIILKWDNATDTFSEYQDANGYCTLDASGSFKIQLNSTSYKLSWRIKLSSSFPTGYVDIVDADIYSGTDHASSSESDLFYFTTYTGWWNADWQKRKPIIITENSGSTLTDYQVAINVTYDSDMQADFDDLRFTWLNETSNSEVLFDAWLESKTDGSWAYIWIEVPEIPANGATVLFMYYNNSASSSYWNKTATMVWWDDFSSDTSSDYTAFGGVSISWDAGGYLKIDDASGVTGGAYIPTISITDAYLETRGKGSNSRHGQGIRINDTAVRIQWLWLGDTHAFQDDYSDGSASQSWTTNENEWHTFKLWIWNGGKNFRCYVKEDATQRENEFTSSASAGTSGNPFIGTSDGATTMYFDYFLVRKYTYPEPSYSIGSEESEEPAAQNLIVTGCYFNTGQQITVKGYVYYEGTTTPPAESITVYAEYDGGVKASTSSLTDGLFTLSWTESSAGLRTYTIYAVAASDGRVSVQNQTVQAFSFFVDSQFRWGFSNDTIASFRWDDTHKRLNVTFSSPSSSKLYIYGRPTYILGETFDLGTDYSAGWTQLDLNRTTSVATAHPNWGDFYVRKLTAGEVTDAYWTDQVFTLVLNGTSGTSATLEIYCGSRGIPKSWSGFTGEPTYDADTTILSGTVTYQSPVTITLDYTIPTSSGSSAAGGGGSSSSAGLSILPSISLSVASVQLIQMHPGETVTGRLSINFTGVNNIRVLSLEFSGAAADWITLAEPLPKTFFKPIGEEVGTGEVELRIIAPENAEPGDYTVPVVVKAEAVGSQIQANGYLTFSITPQVPQISLVPEYMTWIFAAALAGLILYAYLKD